MKTLNLFVLICVFYIANNADVLTYCGENPVTKEECWTKNYEGKYCCFVEIENNQKNKVRNCAELKQDEYDNINDYLEAARLFFRMEGAKIKKFDCNANYIKVAFGLLLLLF